MFQKTVYVVTPNATVRAREVVMISALLDAIAFAEQVRDVKRGYWDENDINQHIAALREAIPEVRPAPRSGVLAALSNGREA
jgi:hypothetical protein